MILNFFNFLSDVIHYIDSLISFISSIFSVVVTLFAIFFTTMPSFISAGFLSVFTLGIVILCLKVIKK